jgi:methylsterol monooxygenase
MRRVAGIGSLPTRPNAHHVVLCLSLLSRFVRLHVRHRIFPLDVAWDEIGAHAFPLSHGEFCFPALLHDHVLTPECLKCIKNEGKSKSLDLSSLEGFWRSAHVKYTPFGVFLFAYITVTLNYVFMGILFALLERSGWIEQYKIQPTRHLTLAAFVEATKNFLSTYLIVIAVMISIGYPFLDWFVQHWADEFPSWWTILWQQAAALVLEDFFEYWGHRLLHVPWLYQRIHKVHHHFQTPFAFTGAYAHPLEIVWLAMATFFPAFILRPHLFTFYVWINLRQFDTTITHCGYDLPNPFHWLPFDLYGGTRFHDFHHTAFNYNFASRFTVIDKLCGTYKMPAIEPALQKKKKDM